MKRQHVGTMVLAGLVCMFVVSLAAAQRSAPVDDARTTPEAATSETAAPTSAVTDFDGNCAGGGAPPCDETTSSIAQYRILVDCQHWAMMTGCPTFNPTTGRLQSPTLRDQGTEIGRSAAFLDGDASDLPPGTQVGATLPVRLVSDADLLLHPYEGPPGTREIHTEIVALNLTDGSGAAVRAGTPTFPWIPPSYGEVESQDASGAPANDFPATSFFNINVEVDVPPCAGFPGGTLENVLAPLLVQADEINDLPPTVMYIHGNTSAVRVSFTNDVPTNGALSGQPFGWLVLAGHGVGTIPPENFPEVEMAAQPSVSCDGAESGGTGDTSCPTLDPRDYAYPVADPSGTMTDLYIGTHDAGMGNYSNWCLPPGWTVSIEPNVRKLRHGDGKTAHGGISAVSTTGTQFCPTVIHFQGPPPLPPGVIPCGSTAAAFGWVFGFDNAQPSHDVDWEATVGATDFRADWTQPVGMGLGPVHGPSLNIPAVSEWGLIVMALLVVVAGTVVIRRYRVQSTCA